MRAIRAHLRLKNPRFHCRDPESEHALTVRLRSRAGKPASPADLKLLRSVAGKEYGCLEPLYRQFNGLSFHVHRDTAGLVVGTAKELSQFAVEWKQSLYGDDADLHEFQREGVAFATILHSANYFVVHGGRVFYSDHDGGDDVAWADDLESFFERALGDPAKFLFEAGCYTRYFDGKTARQFIPKEFVHD